MSEKVSFCPRCKTESSDSTRFCRKCGTSLEIVNRAPTDSQEATSRDQSTKLTAKHFKELKSEITWTAVRGLVTLIVALPSFFLFSIAMGTLGWMIMLLPWLIVLIFIALGVRDLLRSYGMLKDPQAAIAAFNEEKTKTEIKQVSTRAFISDHPSGSLQAKTNSLTGDERREESEFDEKGFPASITEHTTFPLKDSGN
jgi:flagellar biosynthesis/type III secretory pathway M-ring protein FliF/YscJ